MCKILLKFSPVLKKMLKGKKMTVIGCDVLIIGTFRLESRKHCASYSRSNDRDTAKHFYFVILAKYINNC